MKTRSTYYGILFFSLMSLGILAGCSEGEKKQVNEEVEEITIPKFNLVKAKAEIQAANDEFCELIAAKDSVGLTAMYTKDAKLMAEGGPSAVGHEQIQSAMSAIFSSGITKGKIITKEVFGNEDLLVEEANVLLFVGDQQVADEKAIVVWKKVDGDWKLFRDIFNSNLPAE